jgi:hypothetical protein
MKLTTKLLKEMVRKELKESGFLQQKLGPVFDADAYRETNEYSVAFEQMEDYYYDYLIDGGMSEEEIRKDLANFFGTNPNIPQEEALRLVIDDVLAG